jgi:hypothetical protein
MDRMIAVVDLATGEVTVRTSTTLTLDVPPDLERSSAIVSLDPHAHGRYLATDGKQREYSVFPRPLSWRAQGEECLIAERSGRQRECAGVYRLTVLERE